MANATPLFRKLGEYSSAVTNHSNLHNEDDTSYFVLEMEDVLFHLDSCVMMPENPSGASSKQGQNKSETTQAQEEITGVKALAVVFRQIEFDSEKKMLLTAHTDTSGGAAYNFTLAKERGENVLFLLTGERDAWAGTSAAHHQIEDYQQILTWVNKNVPALECDPQGVDNRWGPNTEKALRQYITGCMYPAVTYPDNQTIADKLLTVVKKDPHKKLPKEFWLSFFLHYENALREALGEPPCDDTVEVSQPLPSTAEMDSMAERRRVLVASFLKTLPVVNCGETFPIDKHEKNNYRSQTNRRVEVLFFDPGVDGERLNVAALEQCDKKTGILPSSPENLTAYRAACPFWQYRLSPHYIEKTDLHAVVYHLRFIYNDWRTRKAASVPAGLTIHAFKAHAGAEPEEISTEQMYRRGVYYVKVKFSKTSDNPPAEEIFFTFETDDAWILTPSDTNAPASIVTMSKDSVKKLDKAKRREYSKLPDTWSSRDYWTYYTYDAQSTGPFDTGDKYPKVFKDILELKPFGSKVTKAGKPMTFSLDPQLDDTPAVVLYPSLGCPGMVVWNGDVATLTMILYGVSPSEKPAQEITAEKVNIHLKKIRWQGGDGTGVCEAKKAILTDDDMPPEFADQLFPDTETAKRNIVVTKFDATQTSGSFYKSDKGFFAGNNLAFVLDDRGVHRYKSDYDGLRLEQLYQVVITIPTEWETGFYNLFWINRGIEVEDKILQTKLCEMTDVGEGAVQSELLGQKVISVLRDNDVLWSFPVNLDKKTVSLTTFDPDVAVCSFHPFLLPEKTKKLPGVGHAADLHVASRIGLLTKAKVKVIECSDNEMEPIGSLVNDPFVTTCDLLQQMGADKEIDIVLLAGDLIDYLKSFYPVALVDAQWPKRESTDLGIYYDTPKKIWDAIGFGTKPDAQKVYQDGVDFVVWYSLFVKFYEKYGKPMYVVAGNHDPYYWPWGISPRVGFMDIIGVDAGPPSVELKKANENVAADANLTFYEAILAYGRTYGVILESGTSGDSAGLKPAKFELLFTLFTPFSDYALLTEHWTLTGLFWGNEEDIIDIQSLLPGGDDQGLGHLPRSDQAINDTQLALLQYAIQRPNTINMLLTHFTFVSYKEPIRLENNSGARGLEGDVEYDAGWEASEYDMGTFETNRAELYTKQLFNESTSQKPPVHYVFTGHMHRRGLYEITRIDTSGDRSVKTRFWDITTADVRGMGINSARIIVPDSGGNIPRYNLRGEFKGWGSTQPSCVKLTFTNDGGVNELKLLETTNTKANPRIAVALDYLYNVEGDDFISLFESQRMAESQLFSTNPLSFTLRFRTEPEEFDYTCLDVENVRLYTYINDRFYMAQAGCRKQQPERNKPPFILCSFTFPGDISQQVFITNASLPNRRTFISFKFKKPTDGVGGRALAHYNFDSRYNYEALIFHEWILGEHYLRIGRTNQFSGLEELLMKAGNEVPDWKFRNMLYGINEEND